ncbi:MAG TPA: protein-L-isoaspartate(D-aspartate) O-methyltransferase [Bacteroidales bacterium]|nr:protein-L-isoaspartate(D-aspartate) O-methyltransferase [Bacteroidales bacterium]HOH21881.1 protein-L-isoaspartate(D-aspartate) O-methyltransferase [Bacteroidales bacterium]HPZ03197.1 protein-L-isoaspartate(D-aspartate) O-methyltransferase [Bacteroidales bacterium]HQB74557.1 protein-L-isoaspartate(D-aspartate) O-methyltransferase [Bacteroidales bacterium]
MNYLEGARKGLIEIIKGKGIHDQKVLDAIGKVERHLFLESFLWSRAYEDIALPIHCDQTISQPYTVAFQTQLLEVQKGDKILEIGTGSGYQATILSAMGAKVYSIERHYELYKRTKKLLETIDHKIFLFYGDGYQGVPQYAPYDKIIITCGAPNIPETLMDQLKVGGYMVVPVGEDTQVMKRVTKLENNEYKIEDFGYFVFVPMVGGTGDVSSLF